VKISPQSLKTEFGLQNHYGCVIIPIHRSGISYGVKINIFGIQKGANKPSEPEKYGIHRTSRLGTGGLENEIGHAIYQRIGNFV
jgi:hypothetical protein